MSSLCNKYVVLRKRVVDFTAGISFFFKCLSALVQAPDGFRETFGAFVNGKFRGEHLPPLGDYVSAIRRYIVIFYF